MKKKKGSGHNKVVLDIVATHNKGSVIRAFRNNVGVGWQGHRVPSPHGCPPKSVLLLDARPLRAGLCVGSPDVVGLFSVYITPQMVGKRVALFWGAEGKGGSGRLEPEQENFINMVNSMGGAAGEVRSVEDVDKMLFNKVLTLEKP